jgi:hypothetical protein
MNPRPWRPADELDGALERGDLPFAITLAGEVAEGRGRPIGLDTALRFLPLVVAKRPEDYDVWSLRWLGRWIGETPEATVEQAAEVAAMLADLPSEPSAFASLSSLVPGTRS